MENMKKLQFEFKVKPGNDGKSNIICITSIATEDNKTFLIPEEYQAAGNHKEIIRTNTYDMIKKSLKKRYQFRKVWLELTDDLAKIYMDQMGNMKFEEEFLEEVTEELGTAKTQEESSTLNKLLEKLIENTQTAKQENLQKISQQFIIEKFTSKNTNANQWMEIFEKECLRFDITRDEKKIEILRLFMDKSTTDWYSSMIIKLSLNSEWSVWKQKFCETFANKGWSPVIYALLFKYKEGSLLDYAIRKEKLLLDMRNSIDAGTLIDLIAAGLPQVIVNKIDREALKDTTDLHNEISKYEHIVNKKKVFTKRSDTINTRKDNEEHKPCKNCEKLGKTNRYHPEEKCWYKQKKHDQGQNISIKHVNNSKIEAELNNTDQKNDQ